MRRLPRTARLAIEAATCDGHGICALRCPELISLDEWGFASIDRRVVADPTTIRRASRAVRACPAGALRLVEVTDPGAVAAPAPPVANAAVRRQAAARSQVTSPSGAGRGRIGR